MKKKPATLSTGEVAVKQALLNPTGLCLNSHIAVSEYNEAKCIRSHKYLIHSDPRTVNLCKEIT